MAAKPCNGYPSYNAWNVSVWISNDESLYRFALNCLRETQRNGVIRIEKAVTRFMNSLEGSRTPDGVPYSRRSVKIAFTALAEDTQSIAGI